MKRDQTIDFTVSEPVYVNDVIDLIASTTSGLDVSFALISGDATLDGNMLTVTAEGAVVIEATQGGNDENNHATAVSITSM